MVSNTTLVIGCLASVFVVVLGVGYIITSATRKKSKCPGCGASVTVKRAYLAEATGDVKIPAEYDIAYSIFAAVGAMAIAVGILLYVALILFTTIFDRTSRCTVNGLTVVCTDGAIETTVNFLVIAIASFGSIVLIINGLSRLVRTFRTKNMPKIAEFECAKCKKSWTLGPQAL